MTVLVSRRTVNGKKLMVYHPQWPPQWDRAHRQVFILSDGERSVDRISHLLRKPIKQVVHISTELARSGFVEMAMRE